MFGHPVGPVWYNKDKFHEQQPIQAAFFFPEIAGSNVHAG
jgi:hypothetical protein